MSPPALSAQVTLMAVAAVVVGLADATLVALGVAGARGAFQFVPARLWVMAPLTWVVVAALTAAVLLPIARRWTGLLVPVALVTILLLIRLRSHPALLLAALGLVFVLFALLVRPLLRVLGQPRRWTAATLAGAFAVAVAVAASAAPPPGSSPAPTGAPTTAPNVILIFLDTVRYDALFELDGQMRENLPSLSRLRQNSTVFTRAYATSSWTLPSHLSAVTGLAAHELGVSFDAQVYDLPAQTLAERFRDRGYRTAAVISNSFLNEGSGFARGFQRFEQAQAALDLCRTAPGLVADTYWPWFSAAVCNWTASEVTRRATGLMSDDETPWFLTLNYMDAHDPYYVERSCGGGNGYHAAIRCLDRHLAPIVDWRSQTRETVLVVVSDHGELFGEHELERHGNGLFAQLLHVPLMIRQAGREGRSELTPTSISAIPSLIDRVPADAKSGAPVLALLHPPAATQLPSEWSALDASWHLIVRERGDDALYHLETDPSERRNLVAAMPADPGIDRLRAAIAAMRRSPKPDLRKFRSLGYVH